MTTATTVPLSDEQAAEAARKKVGTIVVPTNVLPDTYAFFMHGGTNTYIMRNGTKVVFRPGVVPGIPKVAFVTNVAGYVSELQEQIALQGDNCAIHTEPGYITVTPEMLDPLDSVKKQAIADFMQSDEFKNYMLQQRGVGTPVNSTTEQSTAFTGQNSESISAGAAASDSAVGAEVNAANAALAAAAKAGTSPAPGAPVTLAGLTK